MPSKPTEDQLMKPVLPNKKLCMLRQMSGLASSRSCVIALSRKATTTPESRRLRVCRTPRERLMVSSVAPPAPRQAAPGHAELARPREPADRDIRGDQADGHAERGTRSRTEQVWVGEGVAEDALRDTARETEQGPRQPGADAARQAGSARAPRSTARPARGSSRAMSGYSKCRRQDCRR